MVARLEGRERGAPTLLIMGHTDVVPVDPAGWERDPFDGELVDGIVWGRGAADMLGITAAMVLPLTNAHSVCDMDSEHEPRPAESPGEASAGPAASYSRSASWMRHASPRARASAVATAAPFPRLRS